MSLPENTITELSCDDVSPKDEDEKKKMMLSDYDNDDEYYCEHLIDEEDSPNMKIDSNQHAIITDYSK